MLPHAESPECCAPANVFQSGRVLAISGGGPQTGIWVRAHQSFTIRSKEKALAEHLYVMLSYGHLTWEWAAGVRGYAHPAIFAALYKVGMQIHTHCSCQ